MAGPRARKVRDWYIIALDSGEVVGYLRREANGFTTPCVGGEGRRGRRGGWRRSGGPCGGQGGGGEGGGEEGGGRGRERWRGRGQVAREGVCQGRRCEGDVGDVGDGDARCGGGGDGGGVEEREAARSYDTCEGGGGEG